VDDRVGAVPLGLCDHGSIIHLIQYLIDNHYRAASAANLVSLIFGLCTLGKVVMGFVADRVTARVAATLTLTLNAIGVLLLLGVQHAWVMLPLMATAFCRLHR